MDKILSVTFQKMKNGSHNAFMYDVNRMLANENLSLQGFEKLIEAFNLAYTAEEAANRVRRKSFITEEMVKLNARREEVYASLVYHYESSQRHYDETMRKAAHGISYLIKSIAWMHNMSNVKRGVDIWKITSNLRLPKNQPYIQMLQLDGWMDALDELNRMYQEADNNRNSERSMRGNGNVLLARKVTDKVYQDIVKRMNALMILNETDEKNDFVKLLNVHITDAKKSIAIREGWKKHKKEKQT
jgi:hypothetical protein